jgi:hypothetical protein
MNRRVVVECVVFVTAAACGNNAVTAPQNVAGNYQLIARDGYPVPCCAFSDSLGNLVTLSKGWLNLTSNGTYTYAIFETFTSGTTLREAPLTVAFGQWTSDGRTLTLTDSTGATTLGSAASDSTVVLRIKNHQYEFHRTRAPGITGQYAWIGFDGGAPTCCAKDSGGLYVSIHGGVLEVGFNTDTGTYRMLLSYKYSGTDGSSTWATTQSSEGAYRWDGEILTLGSGGLTPADSLSSGQTRGSVTPSGLLAIQTQHHRYDFIRLIQLPR